MKLPCEKVVWYILPIIRKEYARVLHEKYGFSQREVAALLDLTEAAVSYYLSGKRGNVEVEDEELINEIEKAVENIVENGKNEIKKETCRLCKLMISKGFLKNK
ncbi:MAG TPA: transcriptional regulator [Thermoplasmatales archaeon]|nr:transcriptional regulator [Thermoplasmatales archaeon]